VPSVTATTVWDLPLWAWRGYRALADDYAKQQRENTA
jgi:hypothetical protein